MFFLDGKISGLIDFYFAATDIYAYDIAICLNAWCFERDFSFNVTKSRALAARLYGAPALSEAERAALPVLAQGAAMRFLLTRLYDWLNTPPGALVTPKDPLDYYRRLRFHHTATGCLRLWTLKLRTGGDNIVEIWTDGGCKPNPGPGGWAAILRFSGTVKELSGAEAETTNNRMELTAAAEALDGADPALHRHPAYRQRISEKRHHPLAYRLGAQELAQRRRRSGEEHGSVAAHPGRGEAAPHRLALGAGAFGEPDERTGRSIGNRRAGEVSGGLNAAKAAAFLKKRSLPPRFNLSGCFKPA